MRSRQNILTGDYSGLLLYREYSLLEFVPQPVAQIESNLKVPQTEAFFPTIEQIEKELEGKND